MLIIILILFIIYFFQKHRRQKDWIGESFFLIISLKRWQYNQPLYWRNCEEVMKEVMKEETWIMVVNEGKCIKNVLVCDVALIQLGGHFWSAFSLLRTHQDIHFKKSLNDWPARLSFFCNAFLIELVKKNKPYSFLTRWNLKPLCQYGFKYVDVNI